MVKDADTNLLSKPQQALATVTMPPMMAPLNMMVKVVINEEDRAEGGSDVSRSITVEETCEVEFDKNCVVESVMGLPALQTDWL